MQNTLAGFDFSEIAAEKTAAVSLPSKFRLVAAPSTCWMPPCMLAAVADVCLVPPCMLTAVTC